MKTNLMIKEIAKARGLTLSYIAKKLGIRRSNMSAIASGARGVSLKMLTKICAILGCALNEAVKPGRSARVFKSETAEKEIDNIIRRNYDGIDKSWVNRLMFAQTSHYKNVKRG